MGTRSVDVYQTDSDFKVIYDHICSVSPSRVLIFPSGYIEGRPSELKFGELKEWHFLLTLESLVDRLEFSTKDSRSSISLIDSPVIGVRVSNVTRQKMIIGRYWYITERLLGEPGERYWATKDEGFLRWAESVRRHVRRRARRGETYPGYSKWFLPDAEQRIKETPGTWTPIGDFMFSTEVSRAFEG